MFLANGFETVEALAVLDILRRGGVEVVTVSITEDEQVVSAQKVVMMADVVFKDHLVGDDPVPFYGNADAIFLPGGMPGTLNLEANESLKKLIIHYNNSGKIIAAICAAPSILGHMGLLRGKKATAYPGFEKDIIGGEYTGSGVEICDNIVTARGMGKAIDQGLALLEILVDKQTADKVGDSVQYLN